MMSARGKIKLLAIVGPTASGKTGIAIEVCKQLSGEVISCDSMQIYKGMPIAAAVPSELERQKIPHHLIEFLDPNTMFSVAEYVKLADKAIKETDSGGKLPVLCGGTGLYYSSLVDGLKFHEKEVDLPFRAELNEWAKSESGEILLKELTLFDPETAAKLSPNDKKRIIRAIEIYKTTGITKTEQDKLSRQGGGYDLCAIGLNYRNRDKLYQRINKRIEIMLEMGLIEEARQSFEYGKGGTAAQAIGHKEFFHYFEGQITLEEAINNLKQSTRRYAKRQLTWFGRDERIRWIYMDEESNPIDRITEIARDELKLT